MKIESSKRGARRPCRHIQHVNADVGGVSRIIGAREPTVILTARSEERLFHVYMTKAELERALAFIAESDKRLAFAITPADLLSATAGG